MATEVLKRGCTGPDRPYSQDELEYTRTSMLKSLRLGTSTVYHQKCQHFYKVKKNSKKEKEMVELNCNDVGNCSVCWKISKAPNSLKDAARELVETFSNECYNPPAYLSHFSVEVEKSYYNWLYSRDEKDNRPERPKASRKD